MISTISPAKLLMGRELRGKLPQLEETPSNILIEAKENDAKMKTKTKAYADKRFHCKPSSIKKGDFVILKQKKKNKLSANFSSTFYLVKERQGPVVILLHNGKEIMRNIHLIKKVPKSVVDIHEEDDELECSTDEQGNPHQPPVRRSRRNHHSPERYGEYEYS